MNTPVSYDELNEDVKQWARLQVRKMKREVTRLTLKDRRSIQKRQAANKKNSVKPLSETIGWAMKLDYGQVNRINFRFLRHAIFMEHGVNKFRPITSSNRRPRPFLAPTLNPSIDDLANIISNSSANIVVDNIRFLIPGIVDKRIIKVNNG